MVLRRKKKKLARSNLRIPQGPATTKSSAKPNKIVHLRRGTVCPNHPGEKLRHRKTLSELTIIDLDFTPRGVKKTVTKYIGMQGFCGKCQCTQSPPGIRKFGKGAKYGHGLKAWVAYHRLALRLSYDGISLLLEELFGVRIGAGGLIRYVNQLSQYHKKTEKNLMKRLLTSPVVHVDETVLNIRGANQYVWVFTDGERSIFRLTKTREAVIVRETLNGFSGVLVSDFYAGYDAMQCAQQKCWSHLMRDMNEDLRKAPFDSELETFVATVRDLIVPIFETVDKYGLRARHLNKFTAPVERFYDGQTMNATYTSDVAIKYQKRFAKNKESLFLFLHRDGVPWNNNMAERALRHLALQRKISGSFFEATMQEYLVLLGVTQTCRFQKKSLLQFLLSSGKDIDTFKGRGKLEGLHMR